jgi:hypothetical protein
VKRIVICILALGMLAGFACTKKTDDALRKTVAGKTFVRENGGFGGDFTITLREDGSYEYYEGFLSSYIGMGTWTVEDGMLILTEQGGYDFVYRFTVQDGALVYRTEGSSAFIYVKAADGDRFLPRP